MAEENEDGQEKTEDPTDDRRLQFRERGEVAVSREFTSVFVLGTVLVFLSYILPSIFYKLRDMLTGLFRATERSQMTQDTFISVMASLWVSFLEIIVPVFLLTSVCAVFATFAQTQLNFSWKRLEPKFQRMNILSGLKRMLSGQSVMELTKGIAKMTAVAAVAYFILFSEWAKVPSLLNLSIVETWGYWAEITRMLFWSVAGCLLLVAGGDYAYNRMTLERKMKMTKREVKDEYKRREVDPQIKNRMRRIQRQIAESKALSDTAGATVLVTNPTHYSIAIKYELGMTAPVVLAKGIDFLALKMREIAKENEIPIVENKPLARAIYKQAEAGESIPESLYQAMSEVIRYVFRLNGIKTGESQSQPEQ